MISSMVEKGGQVKLFKIIRFGVVLVSIIAVTCTFAYAQAAVQKAPEVIYKGLELYLTKDESVAVDEWISGGPIPEENARALVKVFRDLKVAYGKCTGYYVVGVETVSPTAKVVYVQINYEKGPGYVKFYCYKQAEGWVVTKVDLNSDYESIVPEYFLKR